MPQTKAMTFRQLRDLLATFTDEQLDMDVMWGGDERGGTVWRVDVLEEDYVNPSGDGWEPKSIYVEDPNHDPDEPIVAKKGQAVLFVD